MACPFPCLELPFLASMWGDGPREPRPERYSVTSFTKPTQAIVLETINDYWSDPFSMVRMTIGSAFHSVMEDSRLFLAGFNRKDKDFEFEKKFEHPIVVDDIPATLVGKSDQYQFSTRTLTDYKGAGTYSYEKAVRGDFSGYDVQVNFYRKYQYPFAETMQLAFWLTDHSKRQWIKGIRPFERVTVPFIPDDVLERLMVEKVRAIRAGLADPGSVAPCSSEERWDGNRCERWCNAAPFCRQYKKKGD